MTAAPGVIFGVLGAFVLVACASSGSDTTGATGTTDTTGAGSDRAAIVVSTAASLGDAFSEIADEFEQRRPGAGVRLNVGSSAQLAAQINHGAPADVIATADEATMTRLVASGEVAGAPEVLAENTLAIVTPPDNPRRIRGPGDLADLDTVALCVPAAPCGRYAERVLRRAGVTLASDHITRGADSRVTLAAVTESDADAAMVYVTDAGAAGDAVVTIAIPVADNEIARYPIAVLRRSEHSRTARAFVDFVTGPVGRRVLAGHGFAAP